MSRTTTKLEPKERTRRRALKRAKSFDYNCDVCSAHEGFPCQSTGRAKAPGTLAAPHKCRTDRAFGYLVLRNWVSPGVADGDTHLVTVLAQSTWRQFQEREQTSPSKMRQKTCPAKVHYRDSARWPDGVMRDMPTCMVERRPLPDGAYEMSDSTAAVTCKRCWHWISGMKV